MGPWEDRKDGNWSWNEINLTVSATIRERKDGRILEGGGKKKNKKEEEN